MSEVGIAQHTVCRSRPSTEAQEGLVSFGSGRELTAPAELLGGGGEVVQERLTPIWPWFVGLALVLLLFDIAARRLPWSRRSRQRARHDRVSEQETAISKPPPVSARDPNAM